MEVLCDPGLESEAWLDCSHGIISKMKTLADL